jgi:hypothetical protein
MRLVATSMRIAPIVAHLVALQHAHQFATSG